MREIFALFILVAIDIPLPVGPRLGKYFFDVVDDLRADGTYKLSVRHITIDTSCSKEFVGTPHMAALELGRAASFTKEICHTPR